MLLGASVPSRTPLATADARGAEVVQIHLSAPRNWRAPRRRDDAETLRESGRVVAAHAPYLCNPASADDAVRTRTGTALQAALDEAGRCGIAGVVVHAGHAAGGGDMDDALKRWVEVARTLSSDVPLLIENTASGDVAPGRNLADVERLFETLAAADLDVPIGCCFDTCHAWAGDPACADDPEAYVRALAAAAGGIDLLHVNDSRDAAGAGRDRHANLATGRIPTEVMAGLVTTAAALGVPAAIVETPSDDGGQAADLDALRRLLG